MKLSGNFNIMRINGSHMKNINIDYFICIIYKNFIYLANNESLKHNPKHIRNLLLSKNMIGLCLYNGQSMIGYIIGQFMRLNDGRYVLYIDYLYVASPYRKKGFGSILLKQMIEIGVKNNINAVLLTIDTEDQKLFNFYTMRGFMYDPYLRKYDRHDVFSLSFD